MAEESIFLEHVGDSKEGKFEDKKLYEFIEALILSALSRICCFSIPSFFLFSDN